MNLEFNFNQSAVIPYRKKENSLEVLLITSMKKKKWIVPKGFVEFNLTPFESAKKEAYEEAGVIGANETVELGSFKMQKSTGVSNVKVFSMEVVKILDEYPEKELRKRKWFPIDEASKTVQIPQLVNFISSLQSKINKSLS